MTKHVLPYITVYSAKQSVLDIVKTTRLVITLLVCVTTDVMMVGLDQTVQKNALSEVMDQTVCITVVETVWETLHVTEGPENVTLGAISDTLENCVKQVVKSERLVKVAAIGVEDTV